MMDYDIVYIHSIFQFAQIYLVNNQNYVGSCDPWFYFIIYLLVKIREPSVAIGLVVGTYLCSTVFLILIEIDGV